jgi:hypothetical protein
VLRPLAYEREPIRQDDAGRMFLLWRRQGHKTTTLAKKALRFMMKKRGGLVTFASASLLVGSELIVREGQVIESAREKVIKDAAVLKATFDEVRKEAATAQMDFKSNGDGLKAEDFTDLFEQQKLEARIWHSKTVFSRTIIIAPNPATARSWSGCVFIDEAGHVAKLADLLEAMEPIMSSDPGFRLLMAGTPPNDEAHFSYELTLPPEGTTFSPDPKGHWYTSQAGLLVHRVDSWDAAAAGLKTFDLDTREEVTPEQHRAKAFDRDAWDRNYGLIFKHGGTNAISLMLVNHAMVSGRDECVFCEDDLNLDWRKNLGNGRIAVGYDIATTEKKTSNPGSLAVVEQLGNRFFARLILVFKTADPEKARSFIKEVLDLRGNRRARRLCIDATNERFFATEIKKELIGQVICELVIASEKTVYGGEELLYKTYLGQLLVNQMEDGLLALPEARYVKDDFRLVRKEKGGFETDIDNQGRHGDTFDSVKLALHGLMSRGGPVAAEAVSVGGIGAPVARGKWKNPFLKMIDRRPKLYV